MRAVSGSGDFTVGDLGTLRAFLHPLRRRLLDLLQADGPATASQLARVVGESTGSTSYHLRQLARFGFAEDDPDQPSRRERRWRATAAGTHVPAAKFVHDPEGWAALGRLVRVQAGRWEAAAAAFLAEPERWGPAWVEAVASDDWTLRLGPEELRALKDELRAVLERHQAASRGDARRGEGGGGRAKVLVHVGAVPVREEPGP